MFRLLISVTCLIPFVVLYNCMIHASGQILHSVDSTLPNPECFKRSQTASIVQIEPLEQDVRTTTLESCYSDSPASIWFYHFILV